MTRTVAATTGSDLVAGIRERLIQIRNDLMAEVADAMSESMDAGKEVASERIELAVTPTGERRAARGLGVPGRVETGAMEDDFTNQTYQLDPDHMQGRFGWIDGADDANGADVSYIELQDDGFVSKGTTVAGVHAMAEAAEVTKATFKQRLTKYVREELS
ncbi:hypothetical protein [Pseudolysinimonas sp.]|uniref:hypothetical protein n=1 Tax=Pseudolysinimonas sp. TaxID=2680009 RepID=UPI003F800C71